jgi:hypothetical protein
MPSSGYFVNYLTSSHICISGKKFASNFLLFFLSQKLLELKTNSWTYNFVEVSGHNLKSSETWGSVENVYITSQFQTSFAEGRGGVKSVSRGDCWIVRLTFVPVTSWNSTSKSRVPTLVLVLFTDVQFKLPLVSMIFKQFITTTGSADWLKF